MPIAKDPTRNGSDLTEIVKTPQMRRLGSGCMHHFCMGNEVFQCPTDVRKIWKNVEMERTIVQADEKRPDKKWMRIDRDTNVHRLFVGKNVPLPHTR